MDMETGNTSSETASLTEAEAVDRLASLFSKSDSADSTETSAAPEAEDEPTEEQEETHSEDEATPETDEQDAQALTEDAPAFDDNTQLEFEGNKITLKELKNGYLRQANFTQKTQALADEKRTYQEQLNSQALGRIQEDRQLLVNILMATGPQQPDESLVRTDRGEWVEQKHAWDKHQALIQAAQQDIQAAQRQQHEQAIQQHKRQQEQASRTFAEQFPDLVGNKAELTDMFNYALSQGFTQQELDMVADPRMLAVLRDGQLGSRGKSQEGKVKTAIANKPALAKPGAPSSALNSTSDAQRRAKANLEKSGSVDSAVAYLATLSKRK